jgi:hypothetical protein
MQPEFLTGVVMATALAVKPESAPATAETVSATMKQLHALADIISEIDGRKYRLPDELPGYAAKGRHTVAGIWSNVLYPLQNPDVEIQTTHLESFADCMKCIQDAIAGHQFDLLPPFIETAHDLITLMAGDKAEQIYAPEEA